MERNKLYENAGDVAGQEAPFAQDKTEVAKFQTYAKKQGWYNKLIDGIWGPGTQAAWDIWCNLEEKPQGRAERTPDVAGQHAWFSDNRYEVGKFQTYAKQQGWYNKRIDGIWGPGTQAAWDIWCNSQTNTQQ